MTEGQTTQVAPPPPCKCHGPALGDLLPGLALALALILLLDRLSRRRRRKDESGSDSAAGGVERGEKK